MFHSFTGTLIKFLSSVVGDGVSRALAGVLTRVIIWQFAPICRMGMRALK